MEEREDATKKFKDWVHPTKGAQMVDSIGRSTGEELELEASLGSLTEQCAADECLAYH